MESIKKSRKRKHQDNKKSTTNEDVKNEVDFSKIETQSESNIINLWDQEKLKLAENINLNLTNESEEPEEVIDSNFINSKHQQVQTIENYRHLNLNRMKPFKEKVTFIEFYPSKKIIITGGCEGHVIVWHGSHDDNKWEILHEFKEGLERFPIRSGFLWSEDRLVLISYYCSIAVISLINGRIGRKRVGNKDAKFRRGGVCQTSKQMLIGTQKGVMYCMDYGTCDLAGKFYVSGKPNGIVFSHSGDYVHIGTSEGRVETFKMNKDRCLTKRKANIVLRWNDYCGSTGVTAVAVSCDNELIAVGNKSGSVNLYNIHQIFANNATIDPIPMKTIPKLVLSINCLEFSPCERNLLFVSGVAFQTISYKLIHAGSGTVYKNFPGFCGKHLKPNCGKFSPNNKYLVLGLQDGNIALYSFTKNEKISE